MTVLKERLLCAIYCQLPTYSRAYSLYIDSQVPRLHLGLDLLAESLKLVHVRALGLPPNAKTLFLIRLGNLIW